MSVYIYRRAASTGARELAVALGGIRVRQVPNLGPNDRLVCWGSDAGLDKSPRILNDVPLSNKFTDAQIFKAKGVSTIEVALRKPIVEGPRAAMPVARPDGDVENYFKQAIDQACEFVENGEEPNFRSPVFIKGVDEFKDILVKLSEVLKGGIRNPVQAVRIPPPVQFEWLSRAFNHVGGRDLLRAPAKVDFYSRKEDFIEEFRIHSFRGKSILAGKKVHRENFNKPIHPWIKSWDGGWRLQYGGVKGTPELRLLAHKAIAALGLDFGAVDIGKKRDGSLVVLEVNRAPGIEGGTIIKYKEAIERWIGGQ